MKRHLAKHSLQLLVSVQQKLSEEKTKGEYNSSVGIKFMKTDALDTLSEGLSHKRLRISQGFAHGPYQLENTLLHCKKCWSVSQYFCCCYY